MPTHYEILGVARDATEDQIKKAYRTLAKTKHTDKIELIRGTPEYNTAEKLFEKINLAYEVLSDPEQRAIYDRRAVKEAEEEKLSQEEVQKREQEQKKYQEIWNTQKIYV